MREKLGIKQSEMIHKMNDKGNQLVKTEQGLHIMICGGGKYFGFIDLEDWDKVKDLRWGRCSGGYLRTTVMIEGRQTWRRMHTLILPNGHKGLVVDHENRKQWDNQKSNLVLKTLYENFQNSDHWDEVRRKQREKELFATLTEKYANDPEMWGETVNEVEED